ncbi:hypothetical protein LRP88_06332 [Fusarium phalaenopsidis]
MTDRIKIHCGLEPGVENALMLVQRTTSILKLDRIVDECLFGGRAIDMAFAESLDDFVGKVLEAAHDLAKAHVSTLKQLISNVERMLGLSPAEAAARFPSVNSTTGFLNFLMRDGSGQE